MGLSDDVADLRERTLIALFGDSVLNSEFGGKNMMILTKADQDAFDSLKTNFLVSNAHVRTASGTNTDFVHQNLGSSREVTILSNPTSEQSQEVCE